jgi:hypothetical protein
VGRNRDSLALHPLIHVDEERRQADCMICGKPCDPKSPKTYSNSEGHYPTMYFHGACGLGKTGEELHVIYFREVGAKLRNGGRPLIFDA